MKTVAQEARDKANRKMVDYLIGTIHDLDPWECGFIKDIDRRMKKNNPLTETQEEKLSEIFERY